MTATIAPEQRTAAKVAGSIYLIAMATSMFAELYLRDSMIVPRDAVQTALKEDTVCGLPASRSPHSAQRPSCVAGLSAN